MKRKNPTACKVRIAIPQYGNRILPRFGQARNFLLADLELHQKEIGSLNLISWDPSRDPHIVNWLGDIGTNGILCCGIHPRFQYALNNQGIWVLWGYRGETVLILEEWLKSTEPEDLVDYKHKSKNFKECCKRLNNTNERKAL